MKKHWELSKAIRATRNEPVVAIETLSDLIKEEFDSSERNLLIKCLKEDDECK